MSYSSLKFTKKMIVVFTLLVVSHLASPAIISIKEQDPMLTAIDNIEGMLYEIPEYEEPDLVEYQLSALGGVPVLSLLDVARKTLSAQMKGHAHKEKTVDVKDELDDVINRLLMVNSKLEKGNINIHFDIEKSIQSLKSLQHELQTDVIRVASANHTPRKHSRTITKTQTPKPSLQIEEPPTNPNIDSEEIPTIDEPLALPDVQSNNKDELSSTTKIYFENLATTSINEKRQPSTNNEKVGDSNDANNWRHQTAIRNGKIESGSEVGNENYQSDIKNEKFEDGSGASYMRYQSSTRKVKDNTDNTLRSYRPDIDGGFYWTGTDPKLKFIFPSEETPETTASPTSTTKERQEGDVPVDVPYQMYGNKQEESEGDKKYSYPRRMNWRSSESF